MKFDIFYLKLLFRKGVALAYIKLCWRLREFLPKEVMLISDRKLTEKEKEYGSKAWNRLDKETQDLIKG